MIVYHDFDFVFLKTKTKVGVHFGQISTDYSDDRTFPGFKLLN